MATVGKCALCGIQAELVKSHIIPEWAYKPIFDSEHRLLRISSQHRQQVGQAHSGEWDRFLCAQCEASLNEYDEYARAVIYSKPGEPTFGIVPQRAKYGVNILNVDYSRVKLFQLSVLWRASVSKRELFAAVDIGIHEPIIRAMIREADPGDAIEYGCVMGALIYEPGKLFHEVVDKPVMYEQGEWTMARFLFAGCVWLYVLSQDAHNFPLRKYFLAPGAPLPLHIGNVQDLPGLVNHLREMGDIVSDCPKSLRDPSIRKQRVSMLSENHIIPLVQFVSRMREERGVGDDIPHFDPADGGVSSQCLFVLEAPGPKAVKSGFVSRNNPDETARNFFELNASAGIPRKKTITWNIVPWFIGEHGKIRAAKKADIDEGLPYLHQLIELLPQLKTIVLVGRKAQRISSVLRTQYDKINIISCYHPSPMFVNRDKERNSKLIIDQLRKANVSLDGD